MELAPKSQVPRADLSQEAGVKWIDIYVALRAKESGRKYWRRQASRSVAEGLVNINHGSRRAERLDFNTV